MEAGDIEGKRMSEIFLAPARTPLDWIEAMGKVALTGVPMIAEEHKVADGRWCRVTAYKSEPNHVVTFSQDITAQKEADELLRKSERKYRLLFEQVQDGVFLLEVASNEAFGYIREVNGVVCRKLGYSRAELVGMPLKNIDPSLTLVEWAKYGEQIKLRGRFAFERMHRTKTGVLFPVEIRAGEIELDGVQYCLAVARDLTEQKRAEKLRRSAFRRLQSNYLLNDLLKADKPQAEKIPEINEVTGRDLSGPLFCFLVMTERWKGQAFEYWKVRPEELFYLHDKILDVLDSDKRWVAWRGPDGIVVLHSGALDGNSDTKHLQEEIAGQIVRSIEDNIPELSVVNGIAEPVAALTYIREGYKQSYLAAFRGSRAWPGKKIYHYSEMGIFQLLPLTDDSAEAKIFIERYLGKLLRYDAEKGTDLVGTLEALLEYGSLTMAAQKLFIHIKTMEFRRNKIESLLGVSLSSFETKMTLALALKLLRLKTNYGQDCS